MCVDPNRSERTPMVKDVSNWVDYGDEKCARARHNTQEGG
jgi:hypothetical protein